MRKPIGSAAVRDTAVLAGVLALYLVGVAIIDFTISPFPGDPDYIYLVNGLDMLALHTPSYFDHPGTPVQIVTALITGATWLTTIPIHGWSRKMDDILLHSQFYLQVISAIFTLTIASAAAFFAWTFRTRSGSLAPAVIGLFVLAASDPFYFSFRRVAPEPILLAATLFLVGLLVRLAFGETDTSDRKRIAIWIGIILALCVTAKVTSGPVILALFALQGRRERTIAMGTFAGTALILLAPMYPHLLQMIALDWRIITHRGDYGSGEAGYLSLMEYWGNIVRLSYSLPELFWGPLLFLSIVVVMRLKRQRLPHNFERMFLVCSAVILAALLLVAKQPRPYYLMPALAFLCLGVSLAGLLVFQRFRPPALATLVFIGALAFNALHTQGVRAATESAEWKDDQRLLNRAARSGCLIVPRYSVDMPQWDLYLGNNFAGDIFGERLDKLYPNFVTYNEGFRQFSSFANRLTPNEVIEKFGQSKCVQLIGPLSWEDQAVVPVRALKLIDKSQFHALYSLQTYWRTVSTSPHK